MLALRGREEELASIRSRTSEASRGAGTITVVEGHAGLGKTRLVEELVDLFVRTDFRFAKTTCWELETERAFGPLLDAFDVRRGSDPARARIAEAISATTDEADLTQVRFRVAELFVDLIELEATEGPYAVVVEDLHWADGATITALNRLAQAIESLPAALVCSTRPTVGNRELDALLRTFKSLGAKTVRLQPLTDDAIEGLAAERLQADVGPRLRAQLASASGNPLFALELVEGLLEDEAIQVAAGVAESGSEFPPPEFHLTILKRFGHLPDATIEALRVAAVAGNRFDLNSLATQLGEVKEIAQHLQPAIDAGLIERAGDSYAFKHDLLRDALYEDIPSPQRVRLHRDLARGLIAAGAAPQDVAVHLAISVERGDKKMIEELREAARAIGSSDPAGALELLEVALEAAGPGEQEAVVRADMVQMLVWTGQVERALHEASTATTVLGPRSDIVGGWAHALYLLDRKPEAVEKIEAILERDSLSERERARLLARASFYAEDRSQVSFERAQEALELARQTNDLESQAIALSVLCFHFRASDTEASLAAGRDAVEIARIDNASASWQPHIFLSLTLAELDRLDEAEAVLEEGARLAEEAGSTWHIPVLRLTLGATRFLQGNFSLARSDFDAAAEAYRVSEVEEASAAVDGFRAVMAIHQNDLASAENILRSVEDAGSLYRLYQLWAWMSLHEARSNRAGALGFAEQIVASLSPPALTAFAPFAGFDLVRVFAEAGEKAHALAIVDMLAAAAERSPVDALQGLLKLCKAYVEQDVDEALAASRLLDRSARSLERGYAHELAGRLLGTGSAGDAAEHLRTAAEIFGRIGAERHERRVDARLRELGVRRGSRAAHARASLGWESLTPTELEVIARIGRGATNRDIAEELFISKRTVETHVSSLMRKLETRSRVELAAEAIRRHSTPADQLRQ